ncbi:polyunsaturated fatty acid lipoxygenase ALOX15B-like isoform X2 [Anomaloglossus baeobatrachus]|uniref:polyunsaturated fatty acid lipoxygenase ALOX15B-like isoform X2 n=1 Tax=Anomaloglossus baeobatrachus TaxID=238106 RepID=UPI003F4FB1AF
MVSYKVTVATGKDLFSGTIDAISISLLGVNGESDQKKLSHLWFPGKVRTFDVTIEGDVGELLSVRLYKERNVLPISDAWYVQYIHVTSPEGKLYQFPVYQWISGQTNVLIPEGTASIRSTSNGDEQRTKELEKNRDVYKWKLYSPGAPYCIDADSVKNLPMNESFSLQKQISFLIGMNLVEIEIRLRGISKRTDSWGKLEDSKLLFFFNRTKISDEVFRIWKEDSFFGYQFLNGVNPMLIKKCIKLPENFPVSSSMVASSLGTSTDLVKELQNGNIFLVDYKILEGVPQNKLINKNPQYIAAPMCLLWKDPEDQLLPLAIQLIIPHLRYTLDINILARRKLIGPGGVFDKIIALGQAGISDLLKKAMQEVTYSGLCLPDDIEARGLEAIPNYYYRDDGRMIWEAMESFVSRMVRYYYKGDESVRTDPELQAWVAEIYEKGFLQHESSGIPSSLETVSSLVKYLTMVIFRCSTQHAAMNNSQSDFYTWMPNGPTTMKRPPLSAKGVTTLQTILDSLPDVNTTTRAQITVKGLSKEPKDQRRLGSYPDVHFIEETPQKFIQKFQEKLAEISEIINEKNQSRRLSYLYLDPKMTENAVSI